MTHLCMLRCGRGTTGSTAQRTVTSIRPPDHIEPKPANLRSHMNAQAAGPDVTSDAAWLRDVQLLKYTSSLRLAQSESDGVRRSHTNTERAMLLRSWGRLDALIVQTARVTTLPHSGPALPHTLLLLYKNPVSQLSIVMRTTGFGRRSMLWARGDLQLQAIVGVLELAEVLLAGEPDGPHEAEHAKDGPAQHALVNAEGEADTVTVQALIHQGVCRAGRNHSRQGRDERSGLLGDLSALAGSLAHHAQTSTAGSAVHLGHGHGLLGGQHLRGVGKGEKGLE